MKQKFQDINFRQSSLDTINKANEIIEDYQARGFTLTLRQLYYQFVARGLIPNQQKEYKRLGGVINDGRLAGLIDWSAIEDRTREVEIPPAWSGPQSILRAVADQYKENPWLKQTTYVEVWIEKEALVGIIDPVCSKWRVPYFACRGYASQSELYSAGQRFRQAYGRDYAKGVVFHLGDHDPSGLDMTRDVKERLRLMSNVSVNFLEVHRLALNMDQIEQYDPPPNPAKETDARFESYQWEFGDSSWELDALDPDVISQLVEDAIICRIDIHAWNASTNKERAVRNDLGLTAREWPSVVEFLHKKFDTDRFADEGDDEDEEGQEDADE